MLFHEPVFCGMYAKALPKPHSAHNNEGPYPKGGQCNNLTLLQMLT